MTSRKPFREVFWISQKLKVSDDYQNSFRILKQNKKTIAKFCSVLKREEK